MARSPSISAREVPLQPIQSRNPFEESFAQLLRTIRLGIVPVGESLPSERELAERLGVSRTTVREAIRALEHAGYVTTKRGRFGGTFVLRQELAPGTDEARMSGPVLQEMLDLRGAVEPGAVALAARRAGRREVAPLREMADAMRDDSDTNYLLANCHFHVALARASKSERLVTIVTDVELHFMDALAAVPHVERSLEHSIQQHQEIVDAIDAGDPAAASAAMEEHLAGSHLMLLEQLRPPRNARKC